jgi:hypothetical protein
MADARPCRHDQCLPPWGYALSRRLAGSAGSASWVPRPPSAVGFADHREAICDPDPSVRSLGAPECSRHCRPPAGWRAVRPQSSRPRRGIAAAARRAPPWSSTGLECARGLPGFCPLQHIQTGAFTHIARVCLTRLRSVSRVSYPPDGFPRSDPSGLVSSRKRSWGCDPSEPCSFRGAVAPLDARCPPDVAIAGPTRHLSRTPSRAEPWFTRAGPPGKASRAVVYRLQGFHPLESP